MSDEALKQLLAVLSQELAERAISPRQAVVHEKADIGPWIRAKDAQRLFGIPKGRLIGLAIAGKVTAKKFDRDDPNSAVVFRTAEIERAIDEMPPYRFEKLFGRQMPETEGDRK